MSRHRRQINVEHQSIMNRHNDSCHGVLLVDKPSGPTSHDVVDNIRKQFRLLKVGHAGTLDPQATGLLVIMIGKATKLANILLSNDKSYDGAMRFGITTDTQDAEGTVLSEADYSHITKKDLLAQMSKWSGDILQTPPMISAAKKGGVPLYKLARRGQTVERQPKLIHIHEFDLLDFTPPTAAFRVSCSKGFYVRTLCADIGEALGCGAILERLSRTRSGQFALQDAHSLEKLLRMTRNELFDLVIPLNRVTMQAGSV